MWSADHLEANCSLSASNTSHPHRSSTSDTSVLAIGLESRDRKQIAALVATSGVRPSWCGGRTPHEWREHTRPVHSRDPANYSFPPLYGYGIYSARVVGGGIPLGGHARGETRS